MTDISIFDKYGRARSADSYGDTELSSLSDLQCRLLEAVTSASAEDQAAEIELKAATDEVSANVIKLRDAQAALAKLRPPSRFDQIAAQARAAYNSASH